MATRMKHQEHGYIIAYGQAQIAELQECGWHIDESYDKPVKSAPVQQELKSSLKPAKHKQPDFHFADLIGHKEKE